MATQPPDDTQASSVSLPSSTGTLLRDVSLILSVLPAIIALVGAKDTVGLITYISSAQFAPALGVIVSVGIVLWRQWHNWQLKREQKK